MMRINTNVAAINAYRNLQMNQMRLTRSLERLSSGLRINRAADDPSGLVRSESLRAQIGGLKVATRNAQDAISLVQTAEGAQAEVHTILQRMRDLTVQSGNLGANDPAALRANQQEFAELASELDRISGHTQFGTTSLLAGERATSTTTSLPDAQAPTDELAPGDEGYEPGSLGTGNFQDVQPLLDRVNTAFGVTGTDNEFTHLNELTQVQVTRADGSGTMSLYDLATEANGAFKAGASLAEGDTVTATVRGQTEFVFQVGANAGQTASVDIRGVNAASLGVLAATDAVDATASEAIWIGDGASPDNIAEALRAIDGAIGEVSDNRAGLGAFQNRMESTIRSLSVSVENLSAAESRIRDADMAEEIMEFTRSQIMVQAGIAMLAQANTLPQMLLTLLR